MPHLSINIFYRNFDKYVLNVAMRPLDGYLVVSPNWND